LFSFVSVADELYNLKWHNDNTLRPPRNEGEELTGNLGRSAPALLENAGMYN